MVPIFVGSQTVDVRVLDETTRTRRVVIRFKHGQCSVAQSWLNALPLAILLAYTRHNLQNIDQRAFGTGTHHAVETIVCRHGVLCNETHGISGFVKHAVYFGFSVFTVFFSECLCVRIDVRTRVRHRECRLFRDTHISDTYGEPLRGKPNVIDSLKFIDKSARSVGAVIVVQTVYDGTVRPTEGFLAQWPFQNLPVDDGVSPYKICRKQHGHALESRPALWRRECGWRQRFKVLHPHGHVAHFGLVHVDTWLCHHVARQQRVLHNPHDRLIRLWRHDVVGHRHQLDGVGTRLMGL